MKDDNIVLILTPLLIHLRDYNSVLNLGVKRVQRNNLPSFHQCAILRSKKHFAKRTMDYINKAHD